MRRLVLTLVLGAITMVGGHFLNRRWDRALLFFVLLALWGLGAYFGAMRHMDELAQAQGDGHQVVEAAFWHLQRFRSGVWILWLASLAFTLIDALRPHAVASFSWTLSGATGAVGLSMITGLVVAAQVLATLPIGQLLSSGKDEDWASLDNFAHFVHLGRNPDASPPTALPAGEGVLTGRFVYDGRPAVGVSLSLVLNGEHLTPRVVTDEQGVFTVPAPEGRWHVTDLTTYGWAHAPEGEFIITSGREPGLVKGRYDDLWWTRSKGVRVLAVREPEKPQLQFTIRPRVTLTWPTFDPKNAPVRLANSTVAWEPYPGASKYLVRILELKREGNLTSYQPVLERTVRNTTTYSLTGLRTIRQEEQAEYRASVLAFTKDGAFLSESTDHPWQATFLLADGLRLAPEGRRARPST